MLNEKREEIFIQKHELVRLLNALSREGRRAGGGLCIVYSKRNGGGAECRKDTSTPGRAYYIMNKVGGAYKTIEPMDSATLHLPSDRDAY